MVKHTDDPIKLIVLKALYVRKSLVLGDLAAECMAEGIDDRKALQSALDDLKVGDEYAPPLIKFSSGRYTMMAAGEAVIKPLFKISSKPNPAKDETVATVTREYLAGTKHTNSVKSARRRHENVFEAIKEDTQSHTLIIDDVAEITHNTFRNNPKRAAAAKHAANLHIENATIGNDILEILQGMPSLERLELTKCDVKFPLLQDIRRQHPKLAIEAIQCSGIGSAEREKIRVAIINRSAEDR